MLGIPAYLYRLLPANPILLRVVSVAGKRKRDFFTRCAYLGLLTGWVIIALASTGSGLSLDELTDTSERIFRQIAFLQLFLVALLAPIFTAGAITQEKDSQTYDILLATPLSNGQIVLGSLLSRLFFIVALLLSGVPVFAITKLFGGVAIREVVISFAIAASTACVTGALATAIATFKVGTRRTIFSFYMLVVTYLVGTYLLAQLEWTHPGLVDAAGNATGELATTSWFSGVNPFLALQTLFAGNRPPDVTALPVGLRRWPIDWYFTAPATFFPSAMMLLSCVLVLPSIALLRRMAQSTSSLQQKLLRPLLAKLGRRSRPPRSVWNNPIAWREARTKASAARASVLRYAFILIGLGGAITILYLYRSEPTQPRDYVQAGSYDQIQQTLHILGENQTYSLAPAPTVRLDGREVPTSTLFGRYEVLSRQTQMTRGVRTITAIDLRTIPGRITRDQAHQFLLGGIIVEVAIILLIVTNAAASTVTREREDGTLDLLLSTPITSRYYLWGKLAGLVSFMLPLVAVPVLSALLFVIVDFLVAPRGLTVTQTWLVLPEAVLLMPIMLVIVVAFATVIGMQMSLRNTTTVRAVMSSLGIVIGLLALLGWCGNSVLDSSSAGPIATVISGFSPLSVIALLVDPQRFGGQLWESSDADEIAQARVGLFICVLIAASVYALIIWTMYKSMVKNFDMTIRRQSR
jgi:ABC-type transport system involved in multi-copper enzyme maturation permease subunit